MRPRRREGLLSRVVDNETLILDRGSGRVHRLNSTASCVWSTCEGRSASEIASHIAAHFDVAPDIVLNDVVATLVTFRRLGLVVDEWPSGASEVTNE